MPRPIRYSIIRTKWDYKYRKMEIRIERKGNQWGIISRVDDRSYPWDYITFKKDTSVKADYGNGRASLCYVVCYGSLMVVEEPEESDSKVL